MLLCLSLFSFPSSSPSFVIIIVVIIIEKNGNEKGRVEDERVFFELSSTDIERVGGGWGRGGKEVLFLRLIKQKQRILVGNFFFFFFFFFLPF